MPRSRISIILIAILTLALGASIACGSKKTEETPKTASTAAATAAASATAVPKTAPSTQGLPGGAGVLGITSATFKQAICNDYRSLASSVPGAAGPPTGAPAASMDATAMQATFRQMVDAAPPELKPDFTVMAKFFGEYTAAMSRAGGDMMKLAQDAQFMQTMQNGSTEMEKAGANVEAWQKKNC